MKNIRLYLELAKPRILLMVLVTTAFGFFLGARGVNSVLHFCLTLLGVGCATGGAAMLNNYLERDLDVKMVRTRDRVLPAGLIEPYHALTLGVGLVLFGVLLLAWKVNLLTGFLVLMAGFLYVLVYTPLKRITWLNTSFGAIPRAIPPLAGWAAATGQLDPGAWVLFAILFVWQHPHFYAIAWIFREDYHTAGFKMLPVVEPGGKRMFRQTIVFSILLLVVSLLPTVIGLTGRSYFCGALLSGLLMVVVALRFARERQLADARRLLRATILYLPALLLLITLDAGLRTNSQIPPIKQVQSIYNNRFDWIHNHPSLLRRALV
jgi:protoheme IX farnesyltransferase